LQQAEKAIHRPAELLGPAGAQNDHVAATAPVIRIEDGVHGVAVGAGELPVFVAVAAPIEPREQFVVEHVAQRDDGVLAGLGLGEPAEQARRHAQPLL